MTKTLLLIFTLLPTLFFAQQDLDLVIEEGTYRPRSNPYNISLKIHFKNNSQDTFHVFQPSSSSFRSDFHSPSIIRVGEEDKPYRIIFEAEGLCEGDAYSPYREVEAKILHIYPSSILTIPPNQRSRTIHASFSANQKLCPEIAPKAKIIYEPKYKQLNTEHRSFLEKKEQEYAQLLEEVNQFFQQEKLKTQGIGKRKTLAATVLQTYNLLEKLNKLNITSNSIHLVIKK